MECKEGCADCCKTIAFPSDLYEAHKESIQRKVVELKCYGHLDGIYNHDNGVVPYTADNWCCFLTKDKRCAIYEHRPQVCRDYGETYPCRKAIE